MEAIRDRMDGDLRLRGLSEVTRHEYLRCTGQFTEHYGVSPELLGTKDVRSYLLHLIEDLHFSPANMKIRIAAIKFLYNVTLERPEVVAAVLSELKSPVYRTLLFCAYGAGLRVGEACRLCVGALPIGSATTTHWPPRSAASCAI